MHDWESALMEAPKAPEFCRVAGCDNPWTHVERAHPALPDSRRCAEHAHPKIHVPA